MTIENCCIINLPKISDNRGNLSFIESENHIPFDIKRVYYLYGVPKGSDRGSHAHLNLQQFVVAMSGSFNVELDDGKNKKQFTLKDPYYGLYVCPKMWRDLNNFSFDAVCLVLASQHYDENDYIRDYNKFLELRKSL